MRHHRTPDELALGRRFARLRDESVLRQEFGELEAARHVLTQLLQVIDDIDAEDDGKSKGEESRELSATVRSPAGGSGLSDYHINVFHSDEDQGYIADIPDLHACSAFGENANRAVAEVLVAKEAWLAAAKDAGRPIPGPRYCPVR